MRGKSPVISVMAVLLILIALVIGTCGPGAPDDGQASGGPLLPAQAAYDVTYYELDLAVEPSRRRIDGSLRVVAEVVEPLDSLVLDLDERMVVERVVSGDSDRPFRHDDGRLWIALAGQADAGESVDATVYYGGEPREAPDAPWSGGFTWAQTSSGVPWIATSNQTEGADLWWPVKDHPSDEPDSMTIRITVPEPLEVASNGRLRNITAVGDSARKYDWFVSTPINSYAVALNIAPYDIVATAFTSTGGEYVPVTFWVLPEHVDEARAHLPEFVDHVRFLEALLGPYPFRADKYGIAHTPFLGMEHQTIIAYGNAFGNDAVFGYDQGFNALHFHELAHEWYGNLVTVRDWKDFWIHEGFASYLEALYAEELHGSEGYRAVIDHQYGRIQNRTPIAYHEARTSKEVYGGDVYMKGSNVLHTLRYLIGDAAFFESLRRMAYPTDAHRTATAGAQTRHVDTDDFVAIAEAASGRELDWFFDTYLYHAELPRLVTEQRDGTVALEWETPADATFEVPLPVRVGSDTVQVEMTGGRGTLDVGGSEFEIDPWRWVLRAR